MPKTGLRFQKTPMPLRRSALFLLVSLLLVGIARTQPSLSSDPQPEDSARLLWGIVSYTRWPAPPVTLRLCLIGETPPADTLHPPAGPIMPEQPWSISVHDLPYRPPPDSPDNNDSHDAAESTPWSQQCEIVFAGELPSLQRRQLLQELTGQPVLTIGQGTDFCSDGGMFCLTRQHDQWRFGANLDAISRSPLRIHPQVLRLGRTAGADRP